MHALLALLAVMAAIGMVLNALVTTYDAGVWNPAAPDSLIRRKLWAALLQSFAGLLWAFVAGMMYA